VGLDEAHFDKFPHQLSGGQKQRLCIARALASKPKILICDEAVSSLDEALKEKIINLLLGLRKQYGLSIIFISHDISIVEKISQRIIVMDNGEIAELGTPDELLANPKSDTLKKLIESSL
jgi:peptide/nickel transport system ATP-binding protein